MDIIVSDIFGSGGLILVDIEEVYKDSFERLILKWDVLELVEIGKLFKFVDYYCVYKLLDIWYYVIVKVFRDVGFEDEV